MSQFTNKENYTLHKIQIPLTLTFILNIFQYDIYVTTRKNLALCSVTSLLPIIFVNSRGVYLMLISSVNNRLAFCNKHQKQRGMQKCKEFNCVYSKLEYILSLLTIDVCDILLKSDDIQHILQYLCTSTYLPPPQNEENLTSTLCHK
jgi:hypothetical protein